MKTKLRQSLTPIVLKLGLISFFADIASEMLYPITPIFLTAVLGASMTSLGIIEGIAEAISSLLKTYFGNWSDRVGNRRYFIVVGYFISAIAKPAIGIATIWPMVLMARSLDRVGKGVRMAPRDALLADSVPENIRGAAFGWHRAIDTMGAALGPLLAILFLSYSPDDLRAIFYWALIPGLFAVAISFTIKEKPASKTAQATEKKSSIGDVFNRRFIWFLLAWGLFSLANSSDAFLLMRIKETGASTTSVILLFCFYNVIYAAASPWLGHLSDKIPRTVVLQLGFVIFSLVYFGFGRVVTIWQFALLFVLYGVHMAATEGVGKALAVDFVPAHLKATGIGILGTVSGIATVISSTLAGYLWDQFDSSTCFYVSGVLSLLSVLVLQMMNGEYWRRNN